MRSQTRIYKRGYFSKVSLHDTPFIVIVLYIDIILRKSYYFILNTQKILSFLNKMKNIQNFKK